MPDLDAHLVIGFCFEPSLINTQNSFRFRQIHKAVHSQVRNNAPLNIQLLQLGKIIVIQFHLELLQSYCGCHRFIKGEREVGF
jgi:hypothetical protein